jgi:uncharacterized membrane protein
MMTWLDQVGAKRVIILIFVLCSLPVGICSALLTPPGDVPDEGAHLGRAAGLLHGAILPVRKSDFDIITKKPEEISGVKVDAGLRKVASGESTQIDNRRIETEDNINDIENEKPDHRKIFANIPNMVPYFPAAYLPAAIGFKIGLLTNATPLHCFLLGRLAMFAAFFCAGCAALSITAYGESFLLGILLLPMSVFLAGTINQDGVLIGITVLGCAALTNAADSQKFRLFGLACLVIVCAAKAPYLPMLAIILLPFRQREFRKRLQETIIAGLPVVFWVIIVALFVLVPVGKEAYYPGPFYRGDRSILLDHTDSIGNLKILLAQPSLLFDLPLKHTEQWGINNLREMIGILGALQIGFSDRYYQIWGAACVIALAGVPFAGKLEKINWCDAIANLLFVAALICLSWWLILISDYLAWTDAGENFIDGFQGRYLIPLLPFLIYATPAGRAQSAIRQIAFALPVGMLGIYDIGFIPLKLTMGFYLH